MGLFGSLGRSSRLVSGKSGKGELIYHFSSDISLSILVLHQCNVAYAYCPYYIVYKISTQLPIYNYLSDI